MKSSSGRNTSFSSKNIGYAVGFNGVIYKTINEGKTWNYKSSGTIQTLQSVLFINNDVFKFAHICFS